MLAKYWNRLQEAERRLRRSFGTSLATPRDRFWAKFHYNVFDHAFLRVLWTNFFEVAPGVYRSNQPTHRRFERYAAMGIKTVINLRGEDKFAHYLLERESCDALGLKLVNAKMWARRTADREKILTMIEALRNAEKPLMFHCKSGADRAGFCAATYLLVFENQPVEVAAKQLGLKYIHLKHTKTGVQDYILEIYGERLKRGHIGFEDWIRTEYDKDGIQEAWNARRPAAEMVTA